MEPISLTATAIVTLIFSEAFKEGGKALGQGVSNKVKQLLSVIREKFKAEGTEGLLTRAQENPTERNQSRFNDELEAQMEEDAAFADRLSELIADLKSDERVNQIVLKGIKVKGSATVGDIDQQTTGDESVNQEAVVDVEVGGDLNVGNIKQKS
ncbi:MAG: hypothetical protein F6J86_30340 [Symploca sp. SIO1B1]|nr:hypothetical protein [Symploca sp. SIO1B1]